jgi:hypothetical protein
LRRFLNGAEGSSPENDESDDVAADGRGDARASPRPRGLGRVPHAMGRIGDPIVARRVRSALISRTGHPNLVLGAYLEPPLPIWRGRTMADRE